MQFCRYFAAIYEYYICVINIFQTHFGFAPLHEKLNLTPDNSFFVVAPTVTFELPASHPDFIKARFVDRQAPHTPQMWVDPIWSC